MIEKEILRIEIPNYVRKVCMSNKQRAKYHKFSSKTPKKYLDKTKYDVKMLDREYFIIDKSSGARVVKNSKTVGTPKTKLINGQKIYNQEVHKWDRAKMMDAIGDCFEPYLKNLPKISKFPIIVELEVHDEIYDIELKNQLWDMDNRVYPYTKKFQDMLKKEGIIPDDNIMYITQPAAPRFIPILPGQQKKLVFIIKEETDERVLSHPEYQQFHKVSNKDNGFTN